MTVIRVPCLEHGLQPVITVDCWKCGGEGFSHHDCGEDTCCCLLPEPDVECDICAGIGTYDICQHCGSAEVTP